jgi:isoamylase
VDGARRRGVVYCQDNEVSWVDWSLASRNADLLNFTAAVVGLRRAYPVLRAGTAPRLQFSAERLSATDAQVLDVGGTPIEAEATIGSAFLLFLSGRPRERELPGPEEHTDSVLLAVNAGPAPVEVRMPPALYGTSWSVVVDTVTGHVGAGGTTLGSNDMLALDAHATVVLTSSLAGPAG